MPPRWHCPVRTVSTPFSVSNSLKIWGFLVGFSLKSGSITQVAFILVCRSPAKLSKEWTNPPKRPAPTAIRADSHQISYHDLQTSKIIFTHQVAHKPHVANHQTLAQTWVHGFCCQLLCTLVVCVCFYSPADATPAQAFDYPNSNVVGNDYKTPETHPTHFAIELYRWCAIGAVQAWACRIVVPSYRFATDCVRSLSASESQPNAETTWTRMN